MIDEQAQPPERCLPMAGEGAEVEIDQGGGPHLLIVKLVDHPREPVGELEGGGAPDRRLAVGRVALDQFGEQQAAAQRVDRGRNRIVRSEERRVGKESVSKCRTWWCPDLYKKQTKVQQQTHE